MKYIYLDYAATTPVDNRVLASMKPYFRKVFGNPSSIHSFGQRSEKALEEARRNLADWLGAHPDEIVFTSSGSESDNLALRGAAFAARQSSGRNHLLISPIEHPAVTATAKQLADLHGFELSWIPTTKTGKITTQAVENRLRKNTALVSVMHANNEIGTLNPIREIGQLCRKRGVVFHTDAVQGAAHYPIDLNHLKVDLLSIAGHKFYGPKGVGLLYVRNGTPIIPQITGGSQEGKLRAATQNIPLIVGMAEAYRLIQDEGPERLNRLQVLRDQLIEGVLSTISECQLTGDPTHRLPNHASFVFNDVDGNLLLQILDAAGYACSSGSACKTGAPQPSAVLDELGYPPSWSLGSLRVTLGWKTTQEEIAGFLKILPDCVRQVRRI